MSEKDLAFLEPTETAASQTTQVLRHYNNAVIRDNGKDSQQPTSTDPTQKHVGLIKAKRPGQRWQEKSQKNLAQGTILELKRKKCQGMYEGYTRTMNFAQGRVVNLAKPKYFSTQNQCQNGPRDYRNSRKSINEQIKRITYEI